MTIYCPSCGKPNTDQAEKCASCGKELEKAKPAAPKKFKGTMMMTGMPVPKSPAGAEPSGEAEGEPAAPGEEGGPRRSLAYQQTMLGPMAPPGGTGGGAPPAGTGAGGGPSERPRMPTPPPPAAGPPGTSSSPGTQASPYASQPPGQSPPPSPAPPASQPGSPWTAGGGAGAGAPGAGWGTAPPADAAGAGGYGAGASGGGYGQGAVPPAGAGGAGGWGQAPPAGGGGWGQAPAAPAAPSGLTDKNKKIILWVAVGCAAFVMLACLASGLFIYFASKKVKEAASAGSSFAAQASRVSLGFSLKGIEATCQSAGADATAQFFQPQAFPKLKDQACTVDDHVIDVFSDTKKSSATVLRGSPLESDATALGLDPDSCFLYQAGEAKIVGCSVEDGFKIIDMQGLGTI